MLKLVIMSENLYVYEIFKIKCIRIVYSATAKKFTKFSGENKRIGALTCELYRITTILFLLIMITDSKNSEAIDS